MISCNFELQSIHNSSIYTITNMRKRLKPLKTLLRKFENIMHSSISGISQFDQFRAWRQRCHRTKSLWYHFLFLNSILINFQSEMNLIIAFCAMTWMDVWFYLNVSFDLYIMLVNDANGKHLVAPGVLYVIQKYVYEKKNFKENKKWHNFI